ncbi:MAG: PD-(D/E)XK nuclease family protein [Candidatus Eremiobacteraeota bacterium]|nr:PD-(D/E)XK nuclease family protein [Candidatus Eremiobacteraeota bacterium]MBV8263160.1 PD-(D/E)XK nuclease family protein [Candidatus Eremiobacteraeota bacterium]MBV8667880.1 PD-(D/E)XK nuclease family protein [Candidatus Eremiobacteraeota bacterium]
MADLVNEFAFSWSRYKIFYQCARKLYWQHYGSWGGWDGDAPAPARLAYRLKQLKTLTMLVGETFHAELAEILRRRPPTPKGVPVDRLKADMERRLLKRLRESRNADWERYGDPKHYTILFEDYYQRGIDAAMEAEAKDVLHRSVEGLAAEPFGRRMFTVDPTQFKLIDPANIADTRVVWNGLTLYASPDLVIADPGGGLHIIDWKTGRPFKPDLAQLAVYGIFVTEKFGVPLERLTAHLIYVSARTREEHNVVEGVEEAKRGIETYVADIRDRLTDVSANVAGDIDRFPMTQKRTLCRSCNFRELCGRLDEPALSASGEDEADQSATAAAG